MSFTNKKVVADGYKFDSQDEYKFYQYLKFSEKLKDCDIIVHPKFTLLQKYEYNKTWISNRTVTYTPDFMVGNNVYDVKASNRWSTDVFKLKAKMFMQQYKEYKLYLVSYNKKNKEWEYN